MGIDISPGINDLLPFEDFKFREVTDGADWALPFFAPLLEYVRRIRFCVRFQSSLLEAFALHDAAFRSPPLGAGVYRAISLLRIATLEVKARSKRWHRAAVHFCSESAWKCRILTVDSRRRTGVKLYKSLLGPVPVSMVCFLRRPVSKGA